ncbi:MAG: Pseudouridine-5'-phosphate glycosidase [candidate division WS2 bacterium]|uniref:Pseudouridine-5'-phosphate glycosidase n=1 Tax=Psychracetigena formicireducens TaxID=2986056 RepID=A0A9E2F5G0_PSYF1|nr:Pseudouridine-5'-phosphate glycosidase [Candidatus Psychracetigena formicireducens]MBT9144330.1 Pseudouridine-5'-phosphate glycosidase [Candidatus Psychracetigena formicireducens]
MLNNKPVLALETAVLTHGLPFPDNVELSLALEAVVKSTGTIPATIGIVKGKIKVGLDLDEIEFLGKEKDSVKLSAADLSYAMTKKLSGGTTVSATLFISYKSGIKVFSTGGIGGVHRGWEEGFIDVSQDLIMMSQYEVVIISSGVKAILDIPKTIEYLETLGIPVVGYQTKYFPAFYSYDTPYKLNSYFMDIKSLVDYLDMQSILDQKKSILILNPPPETSGIPYNDVQLYIKKAVKDAKSAGIKGRDLTPYLLKQVNYYSQGTTLQSNKSLLISNAILGSQISLALSNLKRPE